MIARAPPPLTEILRHLRAEPSRTWSVIITVFGDAIVPRGGSVWLGTLVRFFAALDIGDGVVRTAVSRLAADGWLERSRVGRNSSITSPRRGAPRSGRPPSTSMAPARAAGTVVTSSSCSATRASARACALCW